MFKIDYPFKKEILACGAESPAGFCLTKKNCGYIVNDLGSLDEAAVLEQYSRKIEETLAELKIKPKLITHDLHPEFGSTKYAQGLSQKDKKLPTLAVQHHQAHVAACIAENKIQKKVLAIVFDGAALGIDGHHWGGDFFLGGLSDFKRAAYVRYTPLPNTNGLGQDAWQLPAAYLYQAFGEDARNLEIDFVRGRSQEQWRLFQEKRKGFALSSSMEKFFDAVAMLLDLRDRQEYPGRGIVNLERIVNRSSHVAGKIYDYTIKKEGNKFIIYPEPIIENIVSDIKNNISKAIVSAAFHNTLIEITRQVCHKIRQLEKVEDILFCGSVFQNKVLFNRLKDLLTEDKFNIITHRHFAYNDSSIAFGQAVLADIK